MPLGSFAVIKLSRVLIVFQFLRFLKYSLTHRVKNVQQKLKSQRKKKQQLQKIADMSDDDCQCRPLGFLIGLPFAFVCLILSVIGVVIWIVGILLSCLCPCCLCVTVIVELALSLIKAPFSVIKWFTKQIPC